ncbi:MAG: Mth938-like domain-containing protein [Enterobacterales bacterium]|nr:Mth938-like domain-containing protein [Enterobacterales bacterium]
MLIQKQDAEGQIIIKSYQPGLIRLNIGEFKQVILLQNGAMGVFDADASFDQLSPERLKDIIKDKPEVLIIGSGEKHQMLPISLAINQQGIAVESMASREACHTYQMLVYEQRRVYALIFP